MLDLTLLSLEYRPGGHSSRILGIVIVLEYSTLYCSTIGQFNTLGEISVLNYGLLHSESSIFLHFFWHHPGKCFSRNWQKTR